MKLLKGNIGVNLHDRGLGKDFLNTTKTWAIKKIDKMDFVKMKNLWASKGTSWKMRKQTVDLEKIFVRHR